LKEVNEGLILQGKIRKVGKFGCIVNLLNTEEPKIATLHAKEIR
jgi:predicted RNA-binding protein with RPS1 domain